MGDEPISRNESELPGETDHGIGFQLLRTLLVLGSVGILWATYVGMERWLQIANANFDFSLGGWLPWWGGSMLAGLVFGLACWMPRVLRFRASTAVALGVIPLLGMMNVYVYWRVPWWPKTPFGFDAMLLFGVLLGVALAAGFGEGARRANAAKG